MKHPQRITDEELTMVKIAILLPIIMDTLKRDIAIMKASGLKMVIIHVANLKMLMDYITSDIKDVKKSMREHGIKIIEEGKVPIGYKAVYLCRGYRRELELRSEHIKSLVIVKLAEYMEIPIDQCE